eukprot:4589544-Prymnesium_polylepis.1
MLLPGAVSSCSGLNALLQGAGDAVHPIPTTRWVPKGDSCREAAFMFGLEQFDAPFFGISPAEAEAMDPQQRQ